MATSFIGELAGVLVLKDMFSGPLDLFKEKLGTANKVVLGFTAAVGTITAVVGAAASAVAILGQRGAEVNDVAQQFSALTGRVGETADAMLGALREGTLGTINNFDLMKNANKAFGLGLKASADDMKVIGQASVLLADRIGGDTAEAFEKLTFSMAKGQTRGLKQLGLFVDQKAALQLYAEQLGKTTKELNDMDKSAAIQQATLVALRKEISSLGAPTADFADKLTAMKIRLQNVMDEIAVGVANSPVFAAALDAIGTAFDSAFGADSQGLVKIIIGFLEDAAIIVVDLGIAGVETARVFVTAWNAIKVVVMGTLSVFSFAAGGIANLVAGIAELATKIPGGEKIMGGLATASRNLATAIDETTEGLALQTLEAGKAVVGQGKMHETLDRVGGTLFQVRDAMKAAQASQTDLTGGAAKLGKQFLDTSGDVNVLAASTKAFNETFKKMTSELKIATSNNALALWAKNNLGALTKLADDAIIQGKMLSKELGAALLSGLMQKDAEDRGKAFAEAIGKGYESALESQKRRNDQFIQGIDIVTAAAIEASDMYKKRSMSDYDYQVMLIKRDEENKIAALQRTGQATEQNLNVIKELTKEKMREAAANYQAGIDEMNNASVTVGKSLMESLERIPDMFIKAFTGGGGVLGAAKAIGTDLAQAIIGPMLQGLTTYQKAAINAGGAAASALGGKVAGGTGSMVAGIASQLGVAAIKATAWGTAMTTAGVAGSIALGAATLGIGAAAVGIVKLIKNWRDKKKAIDEANKSITTFQQQIHATLTASQRLEAGGEHWKMTVIGVRDAYLAVGRSTEEAMADVKALWDATTKGPEAVAAAMAKINDAFALQKAAQDALNDSISRYKFTVEELGPALERQGLNEKMEQLFSDWEILNAAGIDSKAIIREMGGEVNKFVQSALRTGTEVPIAMKAMLEEMAAMGELTDAAGNKITDIEKSGISFSMTMTEGFQMVVDGVKELTDVIRISLGGAIAKTVDAIKKVPDIDVRVNYDDPGYDPKDNNENTDGFASGSGGIRNFGKGTTAVLHGQEEVLTATQGAGVAQMVRDALRGGGSGGGGGMQLTLNISGVLDENGLVETVQRRVIPILNRAWEDNVAGARTTAKEVLGV